MLLKDEIGGGLSFNERAAREAAAKTAAFKEQVRAQTQAYNKRLMDYQEALLQRPLLMHVSTDKPKGVFKSPDAKVALRDRKSPPRARSAGRMRTDPLMDARGPPTFEEIEQGRRRVL